MTYVGATSLLDPLAGLGLGRGWAWQPKIDGCYSEATTDDLGRIASVRSRTGRELPEASDLIGIVAGPPLSTMVGEIEAHTESGVRAASARGYRLIHLFDCVRFLGADVTTLPYLDRWGLLHRGQALAECDGAARVRSWSTDGAGRAHGVAGRYVAAIPRDLRRLPIVPLVRGADGARHLWSEYVERNGGEGLVAVRLDARAGARASKRKIKVTDTTDARVVATDGAAVTVETPRGELVSVRSSLAASVQPGSVVEVEHHGRYLSGAGPRFARVARQSPGARVVRLRPDLS